MNTVWRLTKFGGKATLVGALVYESVQLGVWSSSNAEGAQVLTDFRESVIPATDEYIKQVPTLDKMRKDLKNGWNKEVEIIARGLAETPSAVRSYAKDYSQVAYKKLKGDE